jgi:predicted nucleic acid-binding protein
VNYSLDACALLALFNGEEGDDVVDDLLGRAENGEISLYMSIVQLIEVYYDRIKVAGSEKAAEILETILAYPITIIDTVSPLVLHEAARMKATYRISLADVIGVATAASIPATFVTSDHTELKQIEQNEAIDFLWIRPPSAKK